MGSVPWVQDRQCGVSAVGTAQAVWGQCRGYGTGSMGSVPWVQHRQCGDSAVGIAVHKGFILVGYTQHSEDKSF